MSTHTDGKCIIAGCRKLGTMRVSYNQPYCSTYRAVLCDTHAQGFEKVYGKDPR